MASRSILPVRRRPRPAYLRYSVACAAVAVTLWLRILVTPYVGVRSPNVSLLVAVVFSTVFGGFGPGILATILSAVADWYFVISPRTLDFPQQFAFGVYFAEGILVSYLIDAVRRSRRRINTIIGSISDGLIVFDPQWRFTYLNENAAEMIGFDAKDLIGKSIWERFPHLVGTEFWEKMQQSMRESRPIMFERYSDRRKRWSECSAYPSQEGLTLFTRDITDRKKDRSDLEVAKAEIEKMNQQLERHVQERTAQLHATIKELEAFSYSVSHDLRAPLRAIDGFSKLLLEDYYNKIDAEGRRLIDVIRNSTVRMGNLIDGLLAFSRLGRQALASSEVDMTELAQEAYSEAEGGEPNRNVQIRIDKLPPALGDRVLLRQVFVNLLSNAMKFTRGKNPAVIEVGCTPGGDQNVFYVRDNGVGFDMRYADKLFGVFQRLHGVNEFEGTGLGLAIVQRVIHRHGGRVWAEGALDRGATIFFSLPQLEAASTHTVEDTIAISR